MGVLYEESGTVGTAEYSCTNDSTSIAAKTDVGPIFAFIDANAMAAGDAFIIQVYEKVKSGSTQRLVHVIPLVGAQVEPVIVLPALRLRYGWDITIKKTAGTDRNFDWRIEN